MNVFDKIDYQVRNPNLLGGLFNIVTDIAVPTLTSSTILIAGTSISLLFSEIVKIGSGGNGGWVITMSGGAATMSYSSGDGSNTLIYTFNRTVNSGETGTIAYTQLGNGIEDSFKNDLATIVSAAVTNNSNQSSGPNSYFYGGTNVTAESAWDDYASSLDNAYEGGMLITIGGTGGTLDGIGVNTEALGGATAIKFAVHDTTGDWDLLASGTLSSGLVEQGWNDFAVVGGPTISAGQQVFVSCEINVAGPAAQRILTTGATGLNPYKEIAYASFPMNPFVADATGDTYIAIRIHVQ